MKILVLLLFLILLATPIFAQTTYDVLRLSNSAHVGVLQFGFADVIFENAVDGNGYSLQTKNWFNGSYNNTLKIKANGNIGIGTTNPQAKLEGAGDFRINDGTSAHKGTIRYGLDDVIIENSPDGGNYTDLQFKNWTSSGYRNTLRINGNGNIGIGTSTPDATLTVKGNIHAQEVKVDLAGSVAPDYVFEHSYHLMPLNELAAYIALYKHLPEIPSAEELDRDGLNLKEMNILLLKKIEELTLHLIEQGRTVSEHAKRIEVLEDALKKNNVNN